MKISESPHEMSDAIIAKKATNPTAPREVFGTAASLRMIRANGGELATTNPPTITSAICIVNGTSSQNPLPNSATSLTGDSPIAIPPANTTNTAARAKTKASGNHRSQASAMRIPARARREVDLGVMNGF